MSYGICALSIVPLRAEPSDASEMVSQILYGECMRLLTRRNKWYEVESLMDGYTGWIDAKQFHHITDQEYQLLETEPENLVTDIFEYITQRNGSLMLVPMGSRLNCMDMLQHSYELSERMPCQDRQGLIDTAILFLNSPYMWGGRSFMGIDCSGFTQLVYKLIGQALPRDARDQARKGEALSFIQEAQQGDLAFFDNSEGEIIHVGIILPDNYIIHAHGKVRIDRLDHTGIFNENTQSYSHKLRVIKKIIS